MERGKACRVFAGIGLTAALLACGGEDAPGTCGAGFTGVPPNCVPIVTAPVCTQSQLRADQGGVPAGTLLFVDFPMAEAGRLDMTLDWTFPASPMGLYLVPASTCSLAEFNARTCNFLVRAEPPGAKPRKASSASLSAGNYRYLVANFGTNQESAALQLVLSKGTCPAVSATRPSATDREDELPLAASRVINW